MAEERVEAIRALLVETEEAHGRYESTELGGVYDQAWARWYAGYAVDRGIADLVGHQVDPDRLAEFLASGFAEFEAAATDESWPEHTARRIADEL
jgi:hypothetical protein